ncbi:ribosome biogenesis GTPase Der [Oleiphilus sp. HI0009]|nr:MULTISPECIES: ribosome biogenesis GTPase Der [unclassified Oleiphilus]KZX82115.1 ribosome biogenesis GTPase Der [Oleiphilus sp. HI0009]KZY66359.1 ribosome biogenesis GTPase Der [Oleiphilus sp. HI0066]KZY71792.1 ribosome biogenesis GTPase Der [Oleiphilus sp. HI0067]MCH2157848.1 ribosome biogenesis GTPase Der [Oleiphilaceae bacterium]
MVPVIALVGRPNVGKSTLFNRMTKSRDAIVADYPGLTRDRKYGEGHHGDKKYIVIDTGGLTGDEEGIDMAMAEQSYLAIEEADLVLFVVSARDGLTPADEIIAKSIRQSGKPCELVVNKVDGLSQDAVEADFYKLGIGTHHLTAASQNRGITSLTSEIIDNFPEADEVEDQEPHGCSIGIIGRPNVGKSTLVNRLLGEERVVVFDMPGTTRDSVYIPYERREKPYTIIDTAGVRRRKNVKETVEKFSIVKTLQAIADSNVVVLVIDAREGVVEQDLHLLGFAMDAGRAIVIAVNKWDGMTGEEKDAVKNELSRRLVFMDYANTHFISAKHGSGVGDMYKSIDQAYKSAFAKWPTKRLTELLQDAVSDHQPPVVRGRRIKLRFAHQGGSNPPVIVVHGSKTDDLPDSYKRYLENTFRKVLKVKGTPIRFDFKSSENPFANPTNKLSAKDKVKANRKNEAKAFESRRSKKNRRGSKGKR